MKPNEVDVPEPETPIRGIAARLCSVMEELETIPMTGRNDHFRYTYATAADITKAIRPLLAKHGLVLIPSIVEHHQDPLEKSLHTTVTVEYLIMAEGCEPTRARWVSEAEDSSDKGMAKALTGNLKTFLSKLFQIDTGDDPEADSPTDERAAEREAGGPRSGARGSRPAAGGRPASDRQVAYLRILLEKKEMDQEEHDQVLARVTAHEKGEHPLGGKEASDWIAEFKDRPDAAMAEMDWDGGGPYDGPESGDDPRFL